MMAKPPKAPAIFVGTGNLIRPNLTLIGAKTKLYEAGFDWLAGGACAATFAAPDNPDRVVKLVCQDTGHCEAVELFQEHTRIKSFPRIYGFAWLTDGNFAYETERLVPLDYEWEGWDFDWSDHVSDRAYTLVRGAPDMNEHNIMRREDGDYVVVDPFHGFDATVAERRAFFGSGCRSGYELADEEADPWANVRWRAKPRLAA